MARRVGGRRPRGRRRPVELEATATPRVIVVTGVIAAGKPTLGQRPKQGYAQTPGETAEAALERLDEAPVAS